ncbi:tRNA adenosine(34) deaminase TadA [Neisseria lisongii]|uniref:tRNA-specific adenosine deaminase n=1 Tax=Neisseria lisongii TaxID=2912188 RepID=A0AAW5AKQ2_9NEIS|nr:tRNA adenosine(34) deaminase TadA [Neisseria lisongii]MCF7528677.1 tRNA adenosine(34) deaminase TadA [Neisseria lisongii]MCF7529535.1 tRNA adenosine(34) deaminase TadA [Neisseria lisongii]
MPLTTPPISPKTLAALQALGIATLHDLQQTGAVRAFLLLKAAGCTLTLSTLWQFECLCRNLPPHSLADEQKNALRQALKNHPPVAVFPSKEEMAGWMNEALKQAAQAAALGEIPVGAVVVKNGKLIAAAHNTCVSDCDISRHAEIRALAAAGKALQNYRLDGCDVYITLEPCPMCASALIQARVARVIFGAAEPKSGAAGSVLNLFANPTINPHTAILGGVSEEPCRHILQQFFQQRRQCP